MINNLVFLGEVLLKRRDGLVHLGFDPVDFLKPRIIVRSESRDFFRLVLNLLLQSFYDKLSVTQLARQLFGLR